MTVETPLARALRARAAGQTPRLQYAGQPFAGWKAEVVRAFAEILRLEERPPADVVARTEWARDDGPCRREKLWIRTEPGLEVPAFLLLPRDRPGPLPAVVAPHGHGLGKAEVVGDAAGPCRMDYGRHFARAGYAVLCPDLRGFGELAFRAGGQDEAWLAYLYHATGATLQGRRAADLLACAAYLRGRPEVDPARVGVAGLSLGAEMACALGLLDPGIKAVICSGVIRDVRLEVLDVPHCPCTFTPRLFEFFDLPDLAAALAPTPLLIQSGRQDPYCDRLHAGYGRARLDAAYAAAGAADRLWYDRHARAHDFLMPAPLAFFARYL